MPEIIEIKKYADFLNDNLKNKNLLDIIILRGRYKTHKPFDLFNELKKKLPMKINDINTKGKLIYITLSNDYYILITLGLTGGFIGQNKKTLKYFYSKLFDNYNESSSYSTQYQIKYRNIKFESDFNNIYFCDMLSFGTIKIINTKKNLIKKLNTIGPDIMNMTYPIFINRIFKNSNLDKPIGIVLMNQKNISGIGNYLRADILWHSRISPFKLVKKLSQSDLQKIYRSILLLTWGVYNYKYALKNNFIKKTDKLPSDYNRIFFVYNEEYDIYNNKIKKQELYEGSQKRFIYWVPKLQKT